MIDALEGPGVPSPLLRLRVSEPRSAVAASEPPRRCCCCCCCWCCCCCSAVQCSAVACAGGKIGLCANRVPGRRARSHSQSGFPGPVLRVFRDGGSEFSCCERTAAVALARARLERGAPRAAIRYRARMTRSFGRRAAAGGFGSLPGARVVAGSGRCQRASFDSRSPGEGRIVTRSRRGRRRRCRRCARSCLACRAAPGSAGGG